MSKCLVKRFDGYFDGFNIRPPVSVSRRETAGHVDFVVLDESTNPRRFVFNSLAHAVDFATNYQSRVQFDDSAEPNPYL